MLITLFIYFPIILSDFFNLKEINMRILKKYHQDIKMHNSVSMETIT